MVYFESDDYFDYVVTSEEARADKPDNKPFVMALDKLQSQPQEVCMIGGSVSFDIKGAKEANIVSLLIENSNTNLLSSKENTPDVRFNKYADLVAFHYRQAWLLTILYFLYFS